MGRFLHIARSLNWQRIGITAAILALAVVFWGAVFRGLSHLF